MWKEVDWRFLIKKWSQGSTNKHFALFYERPFYEISRSFSPVQFMWEFPLARRFTLATRDRPKSIFFVCGSMTIGVFIRLRTVKIFYFFFGCLTFLFIPAKLFEMVEDWSYLGLVSRLSVGQNNRYYILIGCWVRNSKKMQFISALSH